MNVQQKRQAIEKLKKQFSSKKVAITVDGRALEIMLYGPPGFLSGMSPLINKVNNRFDFGRPIFRALLNSKKRISIIYEPNRRKLGAGAITESEWFTPWWRIYSVKVHELVVIFNQLGYGDFLLLECRVGGKIKTRKIFNEDPKYALMHELFHLWQVVAPRSFPKPGRLHPGIHDIHREVYATRYTNQWRFSETKCIRSMYSLDKVDTVRNYD